MRSRAIIKYQSDSIEIKHQKVVVETSGCL